MNMVGILEEMAETIKVYSRTCKQSMLVYSMSCNTITRCCTWRNIERRHEAKDGSRKAASIFPATFSMDSQCKRVSDVGLRILYNEDSASSNVLSGGVLSLSL